MNLQNKTSLKKISQIMTIKKNIVIVTVPPSEGDTVKIPRILAVRLI